MKIQLLRLRADHKYARDLNYEFTQIENDIEAQVKLRAVPFNAIGFRCKDKEAEICINTNVQRLKEYFSTI